MKVALVSMPFYNPSFSPYNLLKLKAFCDSKNIPNLQIEVLSLHHEFVKYFGLKNYLQVSHLNMHTGIGEWLFKPLAFPNLPDDTLAYKNFFLKVGGPSAELVFNELVEKKRDLRAFLEDVLKRKRLADDYQLVGFTTVFAQNNASFAATRLLKHANPAVVTCLGGPHCGSPMGEEILANIPSVDTVFSGTSLLGLSEFLASGANISTSNSIPGLLLRSNIESKEHLRYDKRISECVELDINHQTFLDEFFAFYPGKQFNPMLMFETSTGCSWGEKSRCAFCGLNTEREKYQSLPSEAIARTISACVKHYPQVKEFHAVDNIVPKEIKDGVVSFADMPEDVVLRYEVRADLSREELLRLAERRIRWIQPGVESLFTKELQCMRKGVSAFQNLIFLKNCLALDIFPSWNILLGTPGVSVKEYDFYFELLPKIFHLVPPSGVYPIRCDRFSPFFEDYEKRGVALSPLPNYNFCYPFSSDSMSRFAYHFSFPNSQEIFPILGRMRVVWQQWKAAWKQKEPPKLLLQKDSEGDFVLDSRSGQAKTHRLSPHSAEVLKMLEKPQTMELLFQHLPHIPTTEVEGIIKVFNLMGLLFSEGELFLSLVVNAGDIRVPFIQKNVY